MIKTKASYDLVMKSIIKEDKIQNSYIPELGRETGVAFSKSDLWVETKLPDGTVWWVPVNRDALADGPLPPKPPLQMPNSGYSNRNMLSKADDSTPPPPYGNQTGWPQDKGEDIGVSKNRDGIPPLDRNMLFTGDNVTPPPPYGDHSVWPLDRNAGIDSAATISDVSLLAKKGNTIGNQKFTFESEDARLPGKAADKDESQTGTNKAQVHRKYPPRYIDPNTGVTQRTQGSNLITHTSYYGRKLVKAQGDGKSSKLTPGFISRNTAKSRRLVDSDGKTVLPGTPGGIPFYKYRYARLVDPLTGENATEKTKNPITYSKFEYAGYRDPISGERVKRQTPGAITAAAYDNLLAELEK